jgi:hypothetical protein
MTDNEYTPTTEQVERRYRLGGTLSGQETEMAEWRAWLVERDRQVAEKAWDEGFNAGRSADHNATWWPVNPYAVGHGMSDTGNPTSPISRTEEGH